MNILRHLATLGTLAGCLISPASAGSGSASSESLKSNSHDAAALFSRTASQTLARDFSSPNISYLFYDARDDRFIAAKWSESDRPVPVGSLVKPFTALSDEVGHVVLNGVGRGHGVGLCQRGATGMALDGLDFRTILAHYFPNTTIESVAVR